MSFIHEVGDEIYHIIPTRLHVALDGVFYRFQDFIQWLGDAHPIYRWFRALLSFLWGLNCHFPLRDIGRYVAWEFGLIYRDLNPVNIFSSVREVSDFEKRKFKI